MFTLFRCDFVAVVVVVARLSMMFKRAYCETTIILELSIQAWSDKPIVYSAIHLSTQSKHLQSLCCDIFCWLRQRLKSNKHSVLMRALIQTHRSKAREKSNLTQIFSLYLFFYTALISLCVCKSACVFFHSLSLFFLSLSFCVTSHWVKAIVSFIWRILNGFFFNTLNKMKVNRTTTVAATTSIELPPKWLRRMRSPNGTKNNPKKSLLW